MKYKNPFEITKAIQFTDEEINAFWVDYTESQEGFRNFMKPESPVPMIILGGKGSGKTHIAKYNSYEVQKNRNDGDVKKTISEEKVIGIYFLLGGLNEGRFRGCGIEQEVWDAVFGFYMEISIALRTLQVLKSFLDDSKILLKSEDGFCKNIQNYFLSDVRIGKSIDEVIAFLSKTRKNIDNQVNNCVFTRKLDVNISLTRGELILNIPYLFSQHCDFMADKKILYIFDEFENIDIYAQKYFHTILRESKPSFSIKLCGRLYALKTKNTFCDKESNMDGSEFELLELDDFLRKDYPQFEKFVTRLCNVRIWNLYPHLENVKSIENLFEDGENFEDPTAIMHFRADKENDFLHFKHFKDALSKVKLSKDVFEKIVVLISCPQHPIVEKFKIFYFYQAWSKANSIDEKKFIDIAQKINREANEFINGKCNGNFLSKSHFKADLFAQFFRENQMFSGNSKYKNYFGLSNFIRLAGGIPRTLLVLLKSAFDYSLDDSKENYELKKISHSAQRKAVIKTSHWFFEDATNCEFAEVLRTSIERLAVFFKEMRFSDKPTECSCISFSFNQQDVSKEALDIIELARTHSLLIEIIDGRKSKKSLRIERMFQLNPILSPKWDLPISRRGTISFSGEFVNSIFDKSHFDEHESLKKARLRQMNAPFANGKVAVQDTFDLFN